LVASCSRRPTDTRVHHPSWSHPPALVHPCPRSAPPAGRDVQRSRAVSPPPPAHQDSQAAGRRAGEKKPAPTIVDHRLRCAVSPGAGRPRSIRRWMPRVRTSGTRCSYGAADTQGLCVAEVVLAAPREPRPLGDDVHRGAPPIRARPAVTAASSRALRSRPPGVSARRCPQRYRGATGPGHVNQPPPRRPLLGPSPRAGPPSHALRPSENNSRYSALQSARRRSPPTPRRARQPAPALSRFPSPEAGPARTPALRPRDVSTAAPASTARPPPPPAPLGDQAGPLGGRGVETSSPVSRKPGGDPRRSGHPAAPVTSEMDRRARPRRNAPGHAKNVD
jgi:hypothetical protein